jgi:hypothetical protein
MLVVAPDGYSAGGMKSFLSLVFLNNREVPQVDTFHGTGREVIYPTAKPLVIEEMYRCPG